MKNWKDNFKPKELGKTLAFAIIFATIFRSLFYQPFAIPSESMLPGLIIGDRLLVQKFSYGYTKYSFPLNMIPFNGKILSFRKPQRGDTVIFKMPEKDNEFFIKRVIGLPGDSVEVQNGTVYVNGIANKLSYMRTDEDDSNPNYSINYHLYRETNQDGFAYYIYRLSKNGTKLDDNFAPVKVPDGHYFVMGDNRNNSRDSRYEDMGYIAEDRIVGNARLIFFSSRSGLYEFWNWSNDVKLSRIFDRLDKSV